MVVRTKRCPNCLRQNVPRENAHCNSCGHAFTFRPAPPETTLPPILPPTARWVEPAPHDVSSAALASLFVVGAGQGYNRQAGKGALLFVVSVLLYGLAFHLWSAAFLVLGFLVWLAAIADAAVVAGRLIDQEQVRPWEWF